MNHAFYERELERLVVDALDFARAANGEQRKTIKIRFADGLSEAERRQKNWERFWKGFFESRDRVERRRK